MTTQAILAEAPISFVDMLADTFADAPFAAGYVDAAGRWLHANATLRALLGDHPPSLASLAHTDAHAVEALLRGEQRHARIELTDGSAALEALAVHDRERRVIGAVVQASPPPARDRGEERDAFFALSTDLLAFVDAQGRFVEVNPAWETTLGWTGEELASRGLLDLVHVDDRERSTAFLDDVRSGLADAGFRNRLASRYGGYRWLEWNARAVDARLYCTARDVTDQVRAREALLRHRDDLERRIAERTQDLDRALARLHLHADNSPLATIEWDHRLHVTHWSRRAAELFGWHEDEVLDRGPSQWPFLHPDDASAIEFAMARLFSREATRNVHSARLLARDGRALACEWFDSALFDAEGRVTSILSLVQDVTERDAAMGALESARGELEAKVAERTGELERLMAVLESQARQDPLTGLPNRRGLMERLPRAVGRGDRQNGATAVMFVDLDRFKQVNDTHGHDIGDALLRECAQRLVASVRQTDIVARLGGDEFIVVLENMRDAEMHARRVAEKIRRALAAPLELAGVPVTISASIGVVIHERGRVDADDLIALADRRMYEAKHAGGNAIRLQAHVT